MQLWQRFELNSALGEWIGIGVCSKYHPFYTGKQKIIDAGGRVERNRKRFGSAVKTMELGGS